MFRDLTRILLGKEEGTYGTDSVPTVAANAIEVSNLKVNYEGELLERNVLNADLSPTTPKLGQRWVEVSFDAEMKWSGTKGTAGRLGDFIEACGFNEVASAGSSVVYTPASGTMKSVTLYVYDLQDSGSSRLNKVTGARGNVTFGIEAGKIKKFGFRFMGLYNAPTDVAVPSAPQYDTTVPPIVESSALSLNGVTSLVVQKIDIDMGNNIVKQDDISSAAGVKGFLITGRKPTGSLNPEKVTQAIYGYAADWLAQTERALSVVIGSASGNKLTITAPKLSIDKITDGAREGVGVDDIPFHLNRSTGNDEINLKFE
ncbi:MAG TPA: phage tail tube protein [Candidatus Omnitrophota bacterium]|nr:phage tail tube protein [Candidatus Omnitrophota bacterium]